MFRARAVTVSEPLEVKREFAKQPIRGLLEPLVAVRHDRIDRGRDLIAQAAVPARRRTTQDRNNCIAERTAFWYTGNPSIFSAMGGRPGHEA